MNMWMASLHQNQVWPWFLVPRCGTEKEHCVHDPWIKGTRNRPQLIGLIFALMIKKKEHLKSRHLGRVPCNPGEPPPGPWVVVSAFMIAGGRGEGGESLLCSAATAPLGRGGSDPLAPSLWGRMRF